MSKGEVDRSGIAPVVLDAQHPWPSLRAFREEHTALFRGRDGEVTDLVRRVKRRLLTVLFGVSGLGKTSLLQAGLFPALRRSDFVPILIRLDHDDTDIDLTEQVRRILKEEVRTHQLKAGASLEEGDLWSMFHRRDSKWTSSTGELLVPVLVFDQFEEIFSRRGGEGENDRRRRRFINQLAALIENRPPDPVSEAMESNPVLVEQYDFQREAHRVVISLREDYLPQLEDLKKRIPSIGENRLRLTRMTETQAMEAVLGPGREVVTGSVAREIVAFVAGRAGRDDEEGEQTRVSDGVDPSLLSLVCSELNAQRLAEGLELITTELLRGKSSRILEEFYLRCFEFLPENQREAAQCFVEEHLLTPAGHRGTVALESAQTQLQSAGVDPEALQQLVRRRLLQLDERHGLQRVELAHDILTTVVAKYRDRRRELAALDRVRQQEQQELAEAHRREELAVAQVQHLRRARLVYGAVGIVFAGLCVLSLWFAQQAKQAKSKLQRVNDDLRDSNRSVQKANEAVERVVDHVTTALLDELGEAKGAQVTTLQNVVKRGLAAFAEIPPELAASPRFRVNRAEMLQAAAQSYSAQNPSRFFDKAKGAATEAISELQSVGSSSEPATPGGNGGTPIEKSSSKHQPNDAAMVPLKLAAAYMTRGDVIRTRAEAELDEASLQTLNGLFADAESDYNAAFAIAERLVRSNPNESAFAVAAAKSLARQGDLLKDRWNRAYGKATQFAEVSDKLALLDTALEKYTRGFEICSRLPESDNSRLSLGADLHNKIGVIHYQKAEMAANAPGVSLTFDRDQEFELARQNYSEALNLRRKLLELDPDSISEKRSLSFTINNLGALNEAHLHWLKTPVERRNLALEAEKLYQERLDLAQQVARADPQNYLYRFDLSEAYRHLAKLYDTIRASEGGDKARAHALYDAAAKASP